MPVDVEGRPDDRRRIRYAGSVHGDAEKRAVMEVLDRGSTAFRIGRSVAEMEARTAELFGKSAGIMVNSGSSALFLAVELLNLPPGSEIVTASCTFSTDLSAIVRAGHVPVFVDVEPDTFNVDAARLDDAISPACRAILLPNLIGNAPDWDVVRQVADAHSLAVIEDSCDIIGHTLRGRPTGTRADISVTSFANSHIITCAGNGGMVCVDDPTLRDRAVVLRRWGRRSELQLFGSRRGDRSFWEPLDGVLYDSLFIFDELGWNFEPSELGAAFGVEQLKRLPENLARRQRNFSVYIERLAQHEDRFVLPRQADDLRTAWLCFPVIVRPGAGFVRSDLQGFLEGRHIDTRTVWTGNAARQPLMRDVPHRVPAGGLPGADLIMAGGMILPVGHALDEDDIHHVCDQIDEFVVKRSDADR